MIVSLKDHKEIIVPDLFQEFISSSSSFSIFSGRNVKNPNKIFKDIRNGKNIIIEDSREDDVEKIYKFIEKKVDELIPYETLKKIRSKNTSRNKKSVYEKSKKVILDRILILAVNDSILSFNIKDQIQNLIMFCGSPRMHLDETYLLPYRFFKDLTEKLKITVEVEAVSKTYRTGINVLLPKSQETYNLFKRSFEAEYRDIYSDFLDMGCGSGVISNIINNHVYGAKIFFTDILPEAVASAKINLIEEILRNTRSNQLNSLEPGNLFSNTDRTFDIIVFNPPWINTQFSNRSEMALNDKDQSVVKEFLKESRHHLNSGGKILLGFSDNSGEEAVVSFENNINTYGYLVENIYSDRIQSYQSGRKWMKIFVYSLSLK